MDDAVIDDERVQHLYEIDREEFVNARAALAKEIGKDDKDAARRIKALRKPTVAAWAVNRVAQQRSEDVDQLLQAGAAVRRAQQRALEGDGGELRNRMEDRRDVVRRLTDEAVALAGETHRDDIDATLEAASIDPEIGELLRRGRLTKPRPRPSGFGVLAGMDFVGEDAGASPGDADDRHEGEARAARELLERQLGEAEGAVERSQAQLEAAEQALAEAERDVQQARAAVERDVETRDAIRTELAGD